MRMRMRRRQDERRRNCIKKLVWSVGEDKYHHLSIYTRLVILPTYTHVHHRVMTVKSHGPLLMRELLSILNVILRTIFCLSSQQACPEWWFWAQPYGILPASGAHRFNSLLGWALLLLCPHFQTMPVALPVILQFSLSIFLPFSYDSLHKFIQFPLPLKRHGGLEKIALIDTYFGTNLYIKPCSCWLSV